MIIERPAIDWLTLTTFSAQTALEIDNMIKGLVGDGETRDMEIDGYLGKAGKGFFFGVGSQKDRQHFMVSFYGDLADRFMFLPNKPEVRCTRIDVQVTLEWPYGNAYRWYVESIPVMQDYENEKLQRARKLIPILDAKDGFCTLYIGSKRSRKFTRLYIKEDDNKDLYIRFETCFKKKGNLSQNVYEVCTHNPAEMTILLAGELSQLPDNAPILVDFHRYIKSIKGTVLPAGRERPTPEKTLRWIAKQVIPAWLRLLGNDDTRFKAGDLLIELWDFWQSVNGNNSDEEDE